MQVVTCRVGGTLRPTNSTRIVIHRRQGKRVVLGVTAPAGTELIFGGAALRPMSGRAGASTFLFSPQSIRQLTLSRFDMRIWRPGERVPLAADCEDCLRVGISSACIGPATALPAPVVAALPPSQPQHDGCRPLLGGA
jgi:hypothetical protein